MAEKEVVVDKDKLNFEGLFSLKDVHGILNDWANAKGLGFEEQLHTESVQPEGRFVEMEIVMDKKVSDYVKKIHRAKIQVSGMNDKVVERNGKKVKLQHGKIQFVFDGILETDFEKRWESKPLFYLIRSVFERYVYSPYLNQFRKEIKDDLSFLKNNLAAYLNLYKY